MCVKQVTAQLASARARHQGEGSTFGSSVSITAAQQATEAARAVAQTAAALAASPLTPRRDCRATRNILAQVRSEMARVREMERSLVLKRQST